MYGPGPVPFDDGCAVVSIDLPSEYEVILLTSEGRKCGVSRGEGGFLTIWERQDRQGLNGLHDSSLF